MVDFDDFNNQGDDGSMVGVITEGLTKCPACLALARGASRKRNRNLRVCMWPGSLWFSARLSPGPPSVSTRSPASVRLNDKVLVMVIFLSGFWSEIFEDWCIAMAIGDDNLLVCFFV